MVPVDVLTLVVIVVWGLFSLVNRTVVQSGEETRRLIARHRR